MEMMTLEKKIAKLPENLKLKVEDYVDALMLDEDQNKKAILAEPLRRPVFGSGKGIFGKMSDDFDEPLEDMREYM
jgi:hypothetical protein